jgi:hypothetical protein
MIVQCNDGWFYKDPVWHGPKTLVQAELGDIWIYYQARWALKERAMRDAARRAGFSVKRLNCMVLPMVNIIGERMVDCSAVSLILKSAPPVPSSYVARIKDCPQETVSETVLKW